MTHVTQASSLPFSPKERRLLKKAAKENGLILPIPQNSVVVLKWREIDIYYLHHVIGVLAEV